MKHIIVNGFDIEERPATPPAPAAPTEPDIDMRVQQAWENALSTGYKTAMGFVMQCDKKDYEMLRDGLQTYLDAPVELGGAGGDTTALVEVIDKDNQPHVMTVAEALQLTEEVKRYFWLLWARKNKFRQALKACTSLDEMDQVAF